MNLVFFHNYFITKDPSENSIICNTSSTCILVASLLPLQFYLLVVHHQYQLLSLSLYPYEESVHDQRGRGHHDQLSLNYRGRHPPIYHMLARLSGYLPSSYETPRSLAIINSVTDSYETRRSPTNFCSSLFHDYFPTLLLLNYTLHITSLYKFSVLFFSIIISSSFSRDKSFKNIVLKK